ncbi:MAG TPA: hypothetical protein VMN82_09290 [Thermoanaerobaculia bacterium]|nr:hypothetical protein [Thermoanaerobaculia bacterium]
MSGRRFRRLLLLVLVVGVGYWIYADRPTVSGIVDSLTNPLMGSKAAVSSSERNRVVGDASATISDQPLESAVGTLHEGMTANEVKDLLGEPTRIEPEKVDGREQTRWTYTQAKRVLVLKDGRVVSIGIL